MRVKTDSTSSSSEDEALIVYKQEKDVNSYSYLHEDDWQQCEFCDEVFQNRYTLYRHNITHMIIPLIKKQDYKCKQCFSHFISANDLESHMLTHHNKIVLNTVHKNNTEVMPGILKSIIEKQVLVKCEDDINILLSRKLSQNGKNSGDIAHGIAEVTNITNKAGSSKLSVVKYEDSSKKTDKVLENMELVESNILKEEPLSPTYVKERASSPTEDEKESIRHRLLFEEDIEDTLFRDISDECNVNIETLCQEVSFDFDDAVSISDSDDAVSVDTFERMNCNSEINQDNGMNNFEYKMNTCDNGIKNIGNRINSFVNETYDFENRNNYESEYETFIEMNNYGNAVNKTTEVEYANTIHFDTLTVPEACICRFCKKEFPYRFQLIQHEATHLKVKKRKWLPPLCCLCERYIAGNYHNLRKHMAIKHPQYSNTNYQTSQCQKCGLKYYNYSKHLEYSHGIYKCRKCENEFDTLQKKNYHDCKSEFTFNGLKNPENENMVCVTQMQLCDLCFSFMKIYMKNRQNYEEIGTKTEIGARQTCDKCNKKFFSVKLVKRLSLRPVSLSVDGRKAIESSQKASQLGQNTPDLAQKAYFGPNPDFARRTSDFMSKNKIRSTKPLSNKERLMKIQNRLKMMKMINKC